MYEDIRILKHPRIHLLIDTYRYLHLHNCTNAPTNYMCTHHTPMYNTAYFLKTHTDLFMHSLIYSLAHTLSGSLSFIPSIFVTSMLMQNYLYWRADLIMRFFNFILSYIYSHARAHTHSHTHTHTQHTHTHRVYVHLSVCISTRVCVCACVIKQII